MKHLLNFSLFLALTAITTTTFAQQFGARAGVNFSTFLVKDNEETYSEDFGFLPGFQIGGTVLLPLTDGIFLESGLLVSTKGYREKFEDDIRAGTVEVVQRRTLNYLEIPITAKAFTEMGDNQLFGLFGPYLGFCLNGTFSSKQTFMGETDVNDGDLDIGSDSDDDHTAFDFGLTIGAGVAFGAVQAGIAYSHGLGNTYPDPDPDDNERIRNRTITVFAAYLFGEE